MNSLHQMLCGRREMAGALAFRLSGLVKLCLAIALAVLPNSASDAEGQEYVILLHGLCRSSHSMKPMAHALSRAGYNVVNVDYPSRTASIEELSEETLERIIRDCQRNNATTIHFVTHSLGGILVRSYLGQHTIPNLGRVVMLAPPNQGSEIVDKLGAWRLFQKINGPAGRELGTDERSTPNQLGAADFCVGVIAGNRSLNWINSLLIPGRDDGKVSVERTKLSGMTDHRVIPTTHPFIMRNRSAIRDTLAFLRTGHFDGQPAVEAQAPSEESFGP